MAQGGDINYAIFDHTVKNDVALSLLSCSITACIIIKLL